ncbi:MAG: PLP-dependent aminotransferase family protein [Cyclobacteriaceae bacterium]|nr:PLP-dependent aminotransferase family protein [Cyclobacteriaceae bacterium]
MLPFKDLIKINSRSDTAAYLQIGNGFVQLIRQGRLKRGMKLPGSRELASLLKVNRMTVVAAFNELAAQGWIEMLPRKGAFVKMILPLLTPSHVTTTSEVFSIATNTGFRYKENKVIPRQHGDFPLTDKLVFNDGFPDVRMAPVEHLAKTMRRLSRLSSQKKYLMYGGTQGTPMLRQVLSSFLNETRGLTSTPENILITRGAQMGLYLAASVILQPGDVVVTGSPGYGMADLTFQQVGARLLHVPVDDKGIDVEKLEAISQRQKIKMVYVIPHHHNPTTVTLSSERRVQLLALAAKYKFAIIEDDYDYDFHYASKPIMPMASIDRNGYVVYVGTFTKTLAPAIRFGFMVAPESFIHAATGLRKLIDTQGDSLVENAIAELYKDGTMARHIKKSVNIYRERRDHFCDLLQSELGKYLSFDIPAGGMSVWTKFQKSDLTIVAARASKKRLIIRDGSDYDEGKIKYNAVRLGFASLNFNEQLKAIEILKTCL